MRALLDINVLIALFDPDHVFHDRSHRWWKSNARGGWASCPLIENGVVRIMSNPAYSKGAQFPPNELIQRLKHFAINTDHEFWPDDLTLRDDTLFVGERLHSSRSITDIYLLGLAVKHEERLATFDEQIPISSVRGAKASNLCLI